MMEEFFDDILNELKEGKMSETEIFLISVEIFAEADGMLSAGEDHIAGETVKQCLKLWKHILNTCDETVERMAFRTFSDWMREGSLHENEQIEKIWVEYFQEREFAEEKLHIIDEMLAVCQDEGRVDTWVARRLSLMEKWGFACERDGRFEAEFRDNHLVRMHMTDRLLAAGENMKALELIRNSLEMFRHNKVMTVWCCRKMTRICRTMDVESYRKALHDILKVYIPCDTVTFRNLKRTYSPAEWYSVRGELFEQMRGLPGVAELYAEEGQYNRLMEYLKEKGDLDEMVKYEECLGEKYAADILETYERIFDGMLRKAVRRRHYRQVIEYMRRLEKYPGGENRIYQIADRWREEYGRKPAFLMELIKL